uniref:Uncharacterized protein n=1 Tax=viral metagenome TaxID=1070528 RepID=A0A6C0I564_9ZZZZ
MDGSFVKYSRLLSNPTKWIGREFNVRTGRDLRFPESDENQRHWEDLGSLISVTKSIFGLTYSIEFSKGRISYVDIPRVERVNTDSPDEEERKLISQQPKKVTITMYDDSNPVKNPFLGRGTGAIYNSSSDTLRLTDPTPAELDIDRQEDDEAYRASASGGGGGFGVHGAKGGGKKRCKKGTRRYKKTGRCRKTRR